MSDSTLSNWGALRDLTLAEASSRFAVQSSQIRDPASYGHLQNLTELNNPDTMPGRLYFAGQDFVLAYISDPHIAADLLRADPLLANAFPFSLASRAGKRSTQVVYPSQGVAFSVDEPENRVDFVEIFKPTTLANYKTQFYVDPGKFVE